MSDEKNPEKKENKMVTRREALKLSGMAVGGLVVGGAVIGQAIGNARADDDCQDLCPDGPECVWGDAVNSNQYEYFQSLDPFYPVDSSTDTTVPKLDENEMRITIMGSSVPPNSRRVQQMMSVFVEVGWDEEKQMPLDQFIFDCGTGSWTNYNAMNVSFRRMDKVFLTHLHGDHMSDLTHIYCFGPPADRKSPLFVWGAMESGVQAPNGKYYADGVRAFCAHLREACRWHSESQSFISTSYPDYEPPTRESWGLPHDPVPVSDDSNRDGYAMIPIELDWRKYGKIQDDNVAYDNAETGAKITHFPVIHTRKGSIGYKLEWTAPNGNVLSMIYTGDTKPEYHSVHQARNNGNGVDVFIHEMSLPAEVWTFKGVNMTEPPPVETPEWEEAVAFTKMVQNSSHSPQGAFGYLLSLIYPRPRLTVACHFPVDDESVACATESVQAHFPQETIYQGNYAPQKSVRMTWAFDRLVITVSKDEILEQFGDVSDFSNPAKNNLPSDVLDPARYHDENGDGDPYAQIDQASEIPSCNRITGECNFREDGY